MKVKSESEVAQLCPTLCDSMDYSLPGSSVHGIFQARVLEWGAITFSMHAYLDEFKKQFEIMDYMLLDSSCWIPVYRMAPERLYVLDEYTDFMKVAAHFLDTLIHISFE